MKRTVDKLTDKQRLALVDLYEADAYKAVKRLLELEREELARKCLTVEPAKLSYIQGQANALKQIHLVIKDLYNKSQEGKES